MRALEFRHWSLIDRHAAGADAAIRRWRAGRRAASRLGDAGLGWGRSGALITMRARNNGSARCPAAALLRHLGCRLLRDPQSVVFSAMPHLGAGYMGIMYALADVHAILSVIFRVRKPNLWACSSSASPAPCSSTTRGEAGAGLANLVGIGLTLPVLLACGNVYHLTAGRCRSDGAASAAISLRADAARSAVTGQLRHCPLGDLPGYRWQVASAAGMFVATSACRR